jgi:UDP-glucose 4-epimerase
MNPAENEAIPVDQQRVLVTGGAGFIGRAVVRALRARGIAVTVVDKRPFHTQDDGIHTVLGDLIEPDVRDAAVLPGTTGIVHLAAITSVLRSIEQPEETFQNNVLVTGGLLELARQRGVGAFVLASTNAVVGDVGDATIREDIPLRPLTPYGATKAACEMMLSGYAGAYGVATAALRFTNVYGPGMEAKDSFVPRMMRAALSGGGVQVYGDGSQRRDLVFLDDIVAGITAALQQRYTGTAIIGGGRSISVLDMIEAARAATGAELPIEHVPAKQGEMPAVIVDVTKAGVDLGYAPSVSLTDGMTAVWEDFLAQQESESASAPAGAR